MIFNWIVLDLHAHDLHKNTEKPGVISFLSQIFCQKAVERERELYRHAKKRHSSTDLIQDVFDFVPHVDWGSSLRLASLDVVVTELGPRFRNRHAEWRDRIQIYHLCINCMFTQGWEFTINNSGFIIMIFLIPFPCTTSTIYISQSQATHYHHGQN